MGVTGAFYEHIECGDLIPYRIVRNTNARSWPSDEVIYCHWHRELEFLYVSSGRLDVRIDSKMSTLVAGDGACVNAGEIHQASLNKSHGLDPTVVYAIIIDASRLIFPTHDMCNEEFISPIVNGSIRLPMFLLADCDKYSGVLHTLDEAIRASEADRPGSRLHVKACIYKIIALLYASGTVTRACPNHRQKNLGKMKRVFDFIDTNYARKLTISELSMTSGLSDESLFRNFKTLIGQSPIAYINGVRLRYALELLRDEELSITDIAMETGFGSINYFIRYFKDIMGETPLQYKKTHRDTNR